MKAIAILAAVLLGLYFIGSRSPEAATATNSQTQQRPEPSGPKVAVDGFSCIVHRTGTDMKGSLRNTSSEPLKFVKIYGTFDGEVFDGYINENPLQPGMTSTFLLPGPSHKAGACNLMYVQDREGNKIN